LGLARDFWYANSWSGKVLPWYSWLVQPASTNVSLQPGYWLVVSWKVLGDFSVPGSSSVVDFPKTEKTVIPHFHRGYIM